MAQLFAVDVRTVNEQLGNIFASGELIESAAVRNFRTTAADGRSYATKHYNLDAIVYGTAADYNRDTPTTMVFVPGIRA